MDRFVMTIQNLKNIEYLEFEIPTQKGLYAITGENGSGKSTIVTAAASAFYVPLLNNYFGLPRLDTKISFKFGEKTREISPNEKGSWSNPTHSLGISGFFEGSIIYGSRFRNTTFNKIKDFSRINPEKDLVNANDFIKSNLGKILHDDEKYYTELYSLNQIATKRLRLGQSMFYYYNMGTYISQLQMSTGENLLLTVLHSLEKRIKKGDNNTHPIFVYLDEIELALHSAAIRRFLSVLKELSDMHNFVVIFSTHSVEIIRELNPNNIYYVQQYTDGQIQLLNPCYPIFATRSLEAEEYGYDFLIMVEDALGKNIVEKIIEKNQLKNNKKILVIPIGGWNNVLRFAFDIKRSNLNHRIIKNLIVLDRDIKREVNSFMRKEHIGFEIEPNYLPIESLEKFLLSKLVNQVDIELFNRLDNYIFQVSLINLTKEYAKGVNADKYKAEEQRNGKAFYKILKRELTNDLEQKLINDIVEYLFEKSDANIEELSEFLKKELV